MHQEPLPMHDIDTITMLLASFTGSALAMVGWLSPDLTHIMSVVFFGILGGFTAKGGQHLYEVIRRSAAKRKLKKLNG